MLAQPASRRRASSCLEITARGHAGIDDEALERVLEPLGRRGSDILNKLTYPTPAQVATGVSAPSRMSNLRVPT